MPLVRTNVTLPAETLAMIDEVAGPRGRSAWIIDAIAASSSSLPREHASATTASQVKRSPVSSNRRRASATAAGRLAAWSIRSVVSRTYGMRLPHQGW